MQIETNIYAIATYTHILGDQTGLLNQPTVCVKIFSPFSYHRLLLTNSS